MKAFGDFILAVVVSEVSIFFLTLIAIAFYGSFYDPKDEVICREPNEGQERWRKFLADERSKALFKTQVHMSYVAVFIAFCYWLATHN